MTTAPKKGSPQDRTPSRFTRNEIERRVAALGKWFHNLDLCGVKTAPDHFLGDYPTVKWRRFAHALPASLEGKTVLDIGCSSGFYPIEMKRRGARRVVAMEPDEDYLAQARFAAEVCEQEIEFTKLSVYNVKQLNERFDLVIFMGVLYHLRYPLLALDLIRRHVAKDLLLFQSMLRGCDSAVELKSDYPFTETDIFENPGIPRLHFVQHCYAGDPTNWWIPNRACVEAMLQSAGFDIIDHPEEEVYLCRCAATSS
ncbi:MAG: TIGR04290 family methyltransferase [Deltaproteobacteria bacterium]|nr:TIGR04290 family methyltransferase [Deltaproteobacteria bacterium]